MKTVERINRFLCLAIVLAGAGTATQLRAELTPGPPSFACDGIQEGSIEALICSDAELAALDRQLAAVYAAAVDKAQNQQPPLLKAEQSGWLKGRDECWKADDRRECVQSEYVRRIAELQALYRLVESDGPFALSCDGDPASKVIVTFFDTKPRTLIAERGDSVSVMYLRSGPGGIRYQGRNETYREFRGKAFITWGYDAPEMRCVK